jgi:hypothetical protein
VLRMSLAAMKVLRRTIRWTWRRWSKKARMRSH